MSSLKDGLTSTARSVADKAGAMFGGKSGEKKEAEAEAFRQELIMKNRNTVVENSRIDDSDYYD